MSIPSAIPTILLVALIAAIQAALGQLNSINDSWALVAATVLAGLLRWLQVSVTPPAGFANGGDRSGLHRWLWGD